MARPKIGERQKSEEKRREERRKERESVECKCKLCLELCAH